MSDPLGSAALIIIGLALVVIALSMLGKLALRWIDEKRVRSKHPDWFLADDRRGGE